MLGDVARSGRDPQRLARDERGLSTTEYLIILVLIGVVGILLWKTFGQAAEEKAGEAAASVQGLRGSAGGGVQGASIRDRHPVGVEGADGARAGGERGDAQGADGASGGAEGARGAEAGDEVARGGSAGSAVYGTGDEEEEGESNTLLVLAVILFAFFASLPFIARMKKG